MSAQEQIDELIGSFPPDPSVTIAMAEAAFRMLPFGGEGKTIVIVKTEPGQNASMALLHALLDG